MGRAVEFGLTGWNSLGWGGMGVGCGVMGFGWVG